MPSRIKLKDNKIKGEGVNFTYVFEREDTKAVSMPPVAK